MGKLGILVGLIGALVAPAAAVARDAHFQRPLPPIVRLFHIPAQHQPKMPAVKPPNYQCVTDSLGNRVCCVRQPLPGWWGKHGWSTWNDCVVLPPAVNPASRSR